MVQYVVIKEEHDMGSLFCLGVFNDYRTAVGEVMENIWEFGESYTEDGDIFEISKPYELEGEGGWCIEVKYKSRHWNHIDEPYKDYYMWLYHYPESEKGE